MDDPTLDRRMKAKDKLIAELLDVLKEAVKDIERTGYVSVLVCIKMEHALSKHKGE